MLGYEEIISGLGDTLVQRAKIENAKPRQEQLHGQKQDIHNRTLGEKCRNIEFFLVRIWNFFTECNLEDTEIDFATNTFIYKTDKTSYQSSSINPLQYRQLSIDIINIT